MERVYDLIENFKHNKTIGIIGANPDSQAFILDAKKLGFDTHLLCQSEAESDVIFGAIQKNVGHLNSLKTQDEFLMNIDILAYYDETLNPSEVADVQKTVVIPQGDDLLSIAQDRVLQKAYLESLSINIAPYITVVTAEDIKKGIRSIGYPAILRTNQLNSENNVHSFFIYEESDIERAIPLLKFGTCVLESWVVSEKEFSISAVKTGSGELKLYPIVNREYRNNRLFSVYTAEDIDKDLEEEIYRVTRVIFDGIDFLGLATIDFLVTPADALYIENIYPYPNILSRYSEFNFPVSATEAHLRAITGLPVPDKLSTKSSAVFVPFFEDQIEWANNMLIVNPEWKFTFYPVINKDDLADVEAVGHIIIPTLDSKETLDFLKQQRF